jgi:SAM-dependent methyltransferase
MNPERVLKQKLGRLRGGRVLDVATGHGNFALALARTLAGYDEIIGVDMNARELRTAREAAARQSLGRLHFRKMDAHKLDFPDASFDTVAISNSLHHMAVPKRVLAEMMRVLKPGGSFIIREMYCGGLNEAQKSHLLFHHLRSDIDTLNGIYHRHSYPRKKLAELYRGLGLVDIDVFDLGPGDADPHKTDAPKHMTEMLDTLLAMAGSPQSRIGNLESKTPFGLVRRIEDVKEHIREHGFLPASSLVAIGRKP